jgi:prepilin-type N-terminal cleavage/methylation domain-containing protein/prepilin-type processing-associated H-X9-DG protein
VARSAFTLIELLVVMTIIGVLLSLLFPAIQYIRNTALQSSCANNLRQIASAALQYQDKEEHLPPAITMPYAMKASPPGLTDASGILPTEMLRDVLGPVTDSPTRVDSDPRYPFGPNWAVWILPYVGEVSLYNRASPTDYTDWFKTHTYTKLDAILHVQAPQRDAWRQVVQVTTPEIYLCPADWQDAPWQGLPECQGPWARGNYSANAGPGWWQMSLDGQSYRETFGMTGPVMGINFGSRTGAIPDGASNTVMFTEVRRGLTATDIRGVWALGYPGSSVTAANAIGDCTVPNDNNEGSDDIDGCPKFYYSGIGTRDHMGCGVGFAGLGWPSWQAQARSRHRAGVNVAFADGSVRLVTNYVSQSAWFSMLSSRDGLDYRFE